MLTQSRSTRLPWIWLIKAWLKSMWAIRIFLSKWFYNRAMQIERMSFAVYILVYLNSVSRLILFTFHSSIPWGLFIKPGIQERRAELREVQKTWRMFTRIPGNLLEDSGGCYYFNIPRNVEEDSGEYSKRFHEIFRKIRNVS